MERSPSLNSGAGASIFDFPRDDQQQFAHVHIPRTGGISIFSFFREVLGPSFCARFGNNEEVRSLERLGPEDLQAFRYIGAHTPAYVLAGKLNSPARLQFSTIRDPVFSEVSAFSYRKAGKSEDVFSADQTFDKYLDDVEEDISRHNYQSHYLWFHPDMHEASAAEIVLEWCHRRGALCTFEALWRMQEYFKLIFNTDSVFNTVNEVRHHVEPSIRQVARIRDIHKMDVAVYNLLQRMDGGFIPDWRYATRA